MYFIRQIFRAYIFLISVTYAHSDGAFDPQIYKIVPKSIADEVGIWPSFEVNVCWKEDYADFAREKGLVQRSVDAAIEKNSKYKFAGWTKCAGSGFARIEIIVDSDRPNSQVGRQKGEKDGTPQERPTLMHLNFTSHCPKDQFLDNCLEVTAVHEFMHALGFLHEHLRKEASANNPQCVENLALEILWDFKGKKQIELTEYDQDSIMNYCAFPERYRQPPKLSLKDIDGLRQLEIITQDKIDFKRPN